jgi:hypothetical protein
MLSCRQRLCLSDFAGIAAKATSRFNSCRCLPPRAIAEKSFAVSGPNSLSCSITSAAFTLAAIRSAITRLNDVTRHSYQILGPHVCWCASRRNYGSAFEWPRRTRWNQVAVLLLLNPLLRNCRTLCFVPSPAPFSY